MYYKAGGQYALTFFLLKTGVVNNTLSFFNIHCEMSLPLKIKHFTRVLDTIKFSQKRTIY